MSSSGYIEYNNPSGTDVDNGAFVGVILETPTDEPKLALPSSGARWSHIEIVLKDTTLNATGVQFFLSWDRRGVQVITNIIKAADKLELHSYTDSGTTWAGAACRLDIVPTFPQSTISGTDDPVQGSPYLYVKTDNGTADKLILARLHWSEL